MKLRVLYKESKGNTQKKAPEILLPTLQANRSSLGNGFDRVKNKDLYCVFPFCCCCAGGVENVGKSVGKKGNSMTRARAPVPITMGRKNLHTKAINSPISTTKRVKKSCKFGSPLQTSPTSCCCRTVKM